MKIFRLKPKF
jgi:hypothetical protein